MWGTHLHTSLNFELNFRKKMPIILVICSGDVAHLKEGLDGGGGGGSGIHYSLKI